MNPPPDYHRYRYSVIETATLQASWATGSSDCSDETEQQTLLQWLQYRIRHDWTPTAKKDLCEMYDYSVRAMAEQALNLVIAYANFDFSKNPDLKRAAVRSKS